MADVKLTKLPSVVPINLEEEPSIIETDSLSTSKYPYPVNLLDDDDEEKVDKSKSTSDGNYSENDVRAFEVEVTKDGSVVNRPAYTYPGSEERHNASSFAELTRTGDTRYFEPAMHAAGLFKRDEIDYFNNRYRFGILNPYHQLQFAREYLFFTKPDLNIYPRTGVDGKPRNTLADYLQTQPEWLEYVQNNFEVIKCLQSSLSDNPFNNLLGNMVSGNLEIPGLTSDTIETANSTYGVNVQYHGSSEASNDNFDFSLEFKDTKLLPVYTFFKAYEDYHTLAHHGVLNPWINYVWYHVLYDQYSIYKFVVDEDGETIVYYGKFYGVFSKSLPRDIFTNTNFDDGINYTVDFHAFSYRDMNPIILKEFNEVGKHLWNKTRYDIGIWNDVFDRTDNRPAQAAKVVWEMSDLYKKPMPKLHWKGDAQY